MVSSRRLAREWALKILYQIDVGKFAPQEAITTALERLRAEFVQRGSRTASGSVVEEIGLDYLTNELSSTLPTLRLPLERAFVEVSARLFAEMPYWQELRFERSFRTQAPGVPLHPPRLLTPTPDAAFVPDRSDAADNLAVQVASLTSEERACFLAFVTKAREELPRRLDKPLQKTGLAFAKDLAQHRPLGATPEALQIYLRTHRETFHALQEERWRKVGTVVQKQIGDWLRTAAFAVKLVDGAHARREEVDRAIACLSSGWRLERQVAVDRNILRLAGFEMLFLPSVPAGATINEAVELAKKYSTAESGRFVNGVLGALAGQMDDKLAPFALPASIEPDTVELDLQDDAVDLPDIAEIEESDAP